MGWCMFPRMRAFHSTLRTLDPGIRYWEKLDAMLVNVAIDRHQHIPVPYISNMNTKSFLFLLPLFLCTTSRQRSDRSTRCAMKWA